MAVRIRLKKFGRTHRPYYRLCAVDSRAPRDGRVIEELGHYDPMLPETDARARLNGERIDYWLSVGAQPSDKAAVLIKKYGSSGSHLDAQREALERLGRNKPSHASAKSAADSSAKGNEAGSTEATGEATEQASAEG